MVRDTIKHYAKIFILEIICIVATEIFMVFLRNYNIDLLELQSQGMPDMDLLALENWKALKFFGIAVALFVFGIFTIFHRKHYITTMKDGYSRRGELFWSIIAIICILLLLWRLFDLIRIPILRMVLKAVGAIGVVVSFICGDRNNVT